MLSYPLFEPTGSLRGHGKGVGSFVDVCFRVIGEEPFGGGRGGGM